MGGSIAVMVAALLAAAPAPAPPAAPQPPPPPTDDQCLGLPAVKPPFAFVPGELLEYDLDALGAQAGKMQLRVLPVKDGALPIEVKAKSNTLFSKIRRVAADATSFLNPRTLRPIRYVEESSENEWQKHVVARFHPGHRRLDVDWTLNGRSGKSSYTHGREGLDVAGAVYLVRTLPWKPGVPICFDVYAVRRIWRLVGKVEGREHVSLPVGEFEAWHLSGVAIRMDDPRQRREVHAWISDDARRLPLVAVGTIDLGAVRATLSGYIRPGDRSVQAQNPRETLKW
jgi:hypothetical protein